MSNADNILDPGKGKKTLSEERLQAYLEGRLSAAEQHEVEAWFADEGMESDAIEGLQQLSAGDVAKTSGSLKQALRKQLIDRRAKRKRYIADNKWGWLAVLIVLLLVILGYAVLRMSVK